MNGPVLLIRSRRAVLPDAIRAAAVRVAGGRIASVEAWDAPADGAHVVDAGDDVLMPGLVDTHVHANEPGRTEWEGFATATRAAAAGGVTTVIEMPLNSIPATTSADGLRQKLRAAEARCAVDVGFWGGLVPGNADQIRPLWEAGVFGFKCFLSPSGVDEFGNVGEAELRAAMPVLAEIGAPLLVHAEWPAVLDAVERPVNADPRAYASYLASRPALAETEAIRVMIGLCREFGTRVHIVHLATEEGLPLLRAARAEGLPITAETCPHYLHFAAGEIADGATEFKCAPPIRGEHTRAALWDALASGALDLVASDHSPCPPHMKGRDAGDWFAAWGGIASLQLGLPVVWTGARARGLGPERVAEWMSAAPARLAGLAGRKGAIAAGWDADLVVWDPDATFTVDADALHHRHPVTPYAGGSFSGVVRSTYVRGQRVYHDGRFAPEPAGRTLLRDR
ncbi:allantoinase AllB [Longimicrobium terrae]|uniref:allantoinase n=1 Tax=Longimicrobium terrae TaxID=1639882 RepID=A0A841H2V5_9BACT|nr:allantoinase AllB [Longimicrobium terrae]MBB4638009.1 allantoinase [Longimicrobium terrae]MBB6072256.1 allantoinase [Longimicrobium terrae]NNC28323.1 allantoinase AllB [Longimicrobium terrae]